jgi:hypothetical protein
MALGQMCDYQELMIWPGRADMSSMQSEQIKILVKSGHYKPEPALIADAMLQRRGVRELLTKGAPLSSVGRTRPAPEVPRQAA